MSTAKYVVESSNSKMGNQKVDVTYASIEGSCPKACPLKDESCYAQTGNVFFSVRKLDAASLGKSALDVARDEAKAIDSAFGGGSVPEGRYLRLHVSGDSRTKKGAKLINGAVKRWKKRGGKLAWSYTHCWRTIHRSLWRDVHMLASVDKPTEAKEAREMGYATAITVSEHPTDKVYKLEGSDVKWIPCPAQTRKVGCSECQLCFKTDWLFESNHGIAFAAHGVRKNSLKRRLNVL